MPAERRRVGHHPGGHRQHHLLVVPHEGAHVGARRDTLGVHAACPRLPWVSAPLASSTTVYDSVRSATSRSIAPTEQYFVADSSTALRTCSASSPRPRTTCSTAIDVSTCGC